MHHQHIAPSTLSVHHQHITPGTLSVHHQNITPYTSPAHHTKYTQRTSPAHHTEYISVHHQHFTPSFAALKAFNLLYHDIVVWPALIWVYMLLAGVWARVRVARQVWGCVVIWHHPLVPCHIPAHRLTSSRMVMEKSVKRKLFRTTVSQ